jgi:hypothetical protein
LKDLHPVPASGYRILTEIFQNSPLFAHLLRRASWNAVAGQSCSSVHQLSIEDIAYQNGRLRHRDIFSSFSLLKLVPLAFDEVEILENDPFDLPLVSSGHPVTKSLLHIKALSV